MQFNPTKSHLVQFSRLRKTNAATLRMGAAVLEEEDSFVYLGAKMDRKLNYKSHFDEAKKRGLDRMMLTRRVSNSNWGLRRGS